MAGRLYTDSMVGYNKDLFILPFDHRSSFIKKMFGIEGRAPNEEEVEKIKNAKKIGRAHV